MGLLAFTPSIAEAIIIIACLSTPVVMVVMFIVHECKASASYRAARRAYRAEMAAIKAERKQWAAQLKAARQGR